MNDEYGIMKNFIVLEGIDGAGTTTQMNLLHQKCIEHKISSIMTCEPTTGDIGILIRKYLSGKELVQPKTLAHLYAADRREHLFHPHSGIVSRLSSGEVVICDRYLFSSLAYQSIDCGFDYVLSLNREFPLPEHLVYLDVPVALGQERLSTRTSREIFEEATFQEKVVYFYGKVLEQFRDSGMKIHVIDGRKSVEEIRDDIWSSLDLLPIQET